jgi:hypothetical protein
MAASRRTVSLLSTLGVVVAVAVAALAISGAFAPAAQEQEDRPPAPRAVEAADAQAALDGATQALLARDRAAWRAALPALGDARAAAAALYRRLSRLPWTELRLVAEPVTGRPGRFYVGAVGELGGAEPDDRIFARRVFDTGFRDGRLVMLDDVTPAAVRHQQVMAFERPVAVRRNGLIVVADQGDLAGAEALADAGRVARERLALLGLTSDEPVVVYYYGSRRQLFRSLGEEPGEQRVRFFSHAPTRMSDERTWARDIGVLGPALDGRESWAPRMLAHELTHAYTTRWFEGARHAPTLLAEGLATAVEGGRSFRPLQDDLAAESSAYPLEKALRAKSLWKGNRMEKVRLAYLEGASLVLYVLERWGLKRLKTFVFSVSDSDLTRAGLDAASRDSLGVSWGELRAGWSEFVQTLP